MANRNSFCARFINYAAVLILVLLSSSANASSFGGGGAGGSWGDPEQCEPEFVWQSSVRQDTYPNAEDACDYLKYANNGAGIPGYSFTGLRMTSQSTGYCSYNGNEWSSVTRLRNSNYDPTCEDKCPAGYENVNGKCQPKKCPVGETLVNGQCKPKTCPAGQALDSNGNCMPRDDQCPAGQTMVNGRCTDKPDDPEPDPNSELPPFCEWASVMCQWHQEWQQWSNDYAANEQKADLDREVIKDLIGESVLRLDDIKTKMDQHKITIDEIKNQDKQFYDELRLWLNNLDSSNGTPSQQNPSIQFPPFCDWSVQVCNWYLDWKDWRNDYNAHNAAVLQKFNDNLTKLEEIKQNDIQHHAVSNEFYDDVREFFGWYKNQEQSDPNDPNDPENPANQDGNVPVGQQIIPLDETQRITFVNGCPAGEQFNVSFMGQSQNIEFSYQPLCQFMSMIRPFVIAIAYLIGAYILMGLSRGSSE